MIQTGKLDNNKIPTYTRNGDEIKYFVTISSAISSPLIYSLSIHYSKGDEMTNLFSNIMVLLQFRCNPIAQAYMIVHYNKYHKHTKQILNKPKRWHGFCTLTISSI